MTCINAPAEEQRKLLTPSVRNEIVRDLVTQMYAFMPRPTARFCEQVGQKLVKQYSWMRDHGDKSCGYVS